jgi:hypothetical protein
MKPLFAPWMYLSVNGSVAEAGMAGHMQSSAKSKPGTVRQARKRFIVNNPSIGMALAGG